MKVVSVTGAKKDKADQSAKDARIDADGRDRGPDTVSKDSIHLEVVASVAGAANPQVGKNI